MPTPPEPDTERGTGGLRRTGDGLRRVVDATRARVEAWVEARRELTLVDLGFRLYERDRDVFASVLGAAIALRLFLFLIPCLVTLVGLLNVLRIDELIRDVIEASGTTGSVASDIEEASRTAQSTGLGLLLTGTVLTVWTGRSLALVLTACSAGAWQIPGRTVRAPVRMLGALIALLFTLIVAVGLVGRIRSIGGIALTSASIAANVALFTAAWLVISLLLPRATSDPGAVLPGALLMGAGSCGLQLLLQLYIPGRLDRASDTFGPWAASMVSLGFLFFLGRLISATFVLDAVLYERLGSVSEFVFALPGLRRVARRSPRVRAFFALESDPIDAGDAR